MDNLPTPELDKHKEILDKLCECLENISIESDACREVALAHGATLCEISEAKKAALLDPEIRKEARETYAAMWKAIHESGEAAFYEEILQAMSPNEKLN